MDGCGQKWLVTRQGKKPVKEVVQAIVKLIQSLEPNHNRD
jgi:hypothetical protein